MACLRELTALTDCYRKHPRQAEVTSLQLPVGNFCDHSRYKRGFDTMLKCQLEFWSAVGV